MTRPFERSTVPGRQTHPPASYILHATAAIITLCLALTLSASSRAETLRVGAGQRFRVPSEAAAVARPGDVVLIRPGRYRDCSIWRAHNLTITNEEPAGDVEISGPVCDGKALFVVAAADVTIRGIIFRGAVAADGNGAGIRAEGANLRVIRSRFEDNQTGILTIASMQNGHLTVEDSVFRGNGARIPNGPCTGHALYAGHWSSVVIRRSRFEATRACHHIKSRAERTEIVDSTIVDGPADGASYLVDIPNGGDFLLTGSELIKGPQAGNPRAAVVFGAEGVTNQTMGIEISNNRFTNRQIMPTIFVENRSRASAQLSRNTLSGPTIPLVGPGTVR